MPVVADASRGSPGGVSWNIPPLVRARAASDELPQGFQLGALEIAHLRGAEASCDVYLVTHVVDGSSHMARVARRSALVEHPELADAMLGNARLLCGRRHPNLLAVLGCGWTDEASPRPYVLHERLVGRDLASYQARHGRIESSLLLAIGMQCAAALDALHQIGLAHADLRRNCAMLVPVGGDRFVIKLAGFESARAIRPGAVAADEPLVASDLAALGIVLRELAAGTEDDEMSVELAGMCARMTASDPGQRPASAAEVHAAIAALRAKFDPAASVTAFMDGLACEDVRKDMYQVEAPPGRTSPPAEFGQVSLTMRVERPVHPIRLAAGPWLTMWILFFSTAAVAMVAALARQSPVGVLGAQNLHVDDEPALDLQTPRTMPDLSQGPTLPAAEIQEPFVALQEPVRKKYLPARPTLEPAGSVGAEGRPIDRKGPTPEPMLPVRSADERPEPAGPEAEPRLPMTEVAVPVEPAKPEGSPAEDEEFDLLPVGRKSTRKASGTAEEVFSVTSL